MGKKIAPAKFRKFFLDKVRGERVIIKLPAPAPLSPKPPATYWAERLVRCGAISQETAEILKAQGEHLSYSGSKQSQQNVVIVPASLEWRQGKPHIQTRRKTK